MEQVPEHLRAAVAHELDRLVNGERLDMMHHVHEYRDHGAELVRQPDEMWDHRSTNAVRTIDGGWHVTVPLWTEDESPSDLSAELIVDADGQVMLHDVHVL